MIKGKTNKTDRILHSQVKEQLHTIENSISKKEHRKISQAKRIKKLKASLQFSGGIVTTTSLKELFYSIGWGDYCEKVENVRKFKSTCGAQLEVINQVPYFGPSTVISSYEGEFDEYNGIIVLEYDQINKHDYDIKFRCIVNLPETYFACRTITGDGILVLVLVNSSREYHARAFNIVSQIYDDCLEIASNQSGINPYVGYALSYDPYAFVNPKPLVVPVINVRR